VPNVNAIPRLRKALDVGEELEKILADFPVPLEVIGVEIVEEGTIIAILLPDEA
jgi:hypothetical protein